ncbi:MAG: S8 family serine peptidase, partial [Chitinophagaceae bacterium]|nr:S8 family serine peptidase [Chitinophagaceae bacterium]
QEIRKLNYIENNKIYYNPNLTFWKDTRYFIFELTINDDVGLNYSKSDFINYLTNNKALQTNINLLSNKINHIETAYPFFKNKLLKKALFIFSIDSNIISLLNSNTNLISNVSKYNRPKASYEPNDYNLQNFYWPENCDNSLKNNFSHLELIRAPQAWDIHRGDNRVRLGVVDAGYNPHNIELTNTVVLTNAIPDFHGTNVVSVINSRNDNNFGLSSIAGFNNMQVFFHDWFASATVKMKQLRLNFNVRAVNNSWYGGSSSILEQISYSELRNIDDLLVVFAAGNDNSTNFLYPPSFNDILNVSGVGHRDPIGSNLRYDKPQNPNNPNAQFKCARINWKDVHNFQISPLPLDAQTHNTSVDVVAPSIHVPCIYDQNSMFRNSGTSFAAPIVTGLAGLIYSINPCLTANQVEDIIKNTADNIYNIPQNQAYLGQLGTGRINAERALISALELGTVYQQNKLNTGTTKYPFGNTTVWGNTRVIAGNNVTSGTFGNVIIPVGSNVKYEASYSIEFSNGFEVMSGGNFEAILRDSPCF